MRNHLYGLVAVVLAGSLPALAVAEAHATCAGATYLDGGRSYQVTLPSESGETISFQVLEPTRFDCDNIDRGAHPLILHGHGFGGARSESGFDRYRDAGYVVISIDQRGFGDSTGTIRVMDPDFEGRDLVKILDWAEENLDYLAYRDEETGRFAPRPEQGSDFAGVNLLAAAIGSSYGGGYQFLLHAVDEKNRLDALAPDITWHDLRYSLNPGDTIKSAWDLLLVAGGQAGSYGPGFQKMEDGQAPDSPTARGLDPYIVETLVRGGSTLEFPAESLSWFNYHSPSYWCGLNDQPQMPYVDRNVVADPNMTATGPLQGEQAGINKRASQPPVDVLLSQGMRDGLFNFNDAWWNYQCLSARGGDVRLMTHQSGHILQDYVPAPGPLTFQESGGERDCGQLVNRDDATLAWFEEKLRGRKGNALQETSGGKLCISLGEGDAVSVKAKDFLAPKAGEALSEAYFQTADVAASNIPHGAAAAALWPLNPVPTAIELVQVTAPEGVILAGIPVAEITLATPQTVNDEVCKLGEVPTLRTGCDATLFIGLGVRAAESGEWRLVDDQMTPVRGIGTHSDFAMTGIGERLAQGDSIGLLVYGFHPQYMASSSRDATMPAVNLTASVRLPAYSLRGKTLQAGAAQALSGVR